MADQTSAVTEAARLEEIRFPEFTAKLVNEVFDGLVAANIKQTQSYLELVQQVGESLATYINNTKDDIGGEQILQFLAKTLPPGTPEAEPTPVQVGTTLSDDQAADLNEALAVPDAGLPQDNKVATTGEVDAAAFKAIHEAVAARIAANRFALLKEMVRQGILRLVVEKGVIETRLTFTTYGSSFYESNASSYHSDAFTFRARARTGFLLSKWLNASAAADYTSVNVRTAQETHRDIAGSNVQIFGRVEIHFRTDYQPLAQ